MMFTSKNLKLKQTKNKIIQQNKSRAIKNLVGRILKAKLLIVKDENETKMYVCSCSNTSKMAHDDTSCKSPAGRQHRVA